MNETVAVAFITAGSTLTAGFLATTASIIIHKSGVKEQERLSGQVRDDQQSARRREIRRDAYVQLLTRFDEVDGNLQKCWQLQPVSSPGQSLPPEITVATGSLASFMTALNIVNLEGTQSVIDASLTASAALGAELATVAKQAVRRAGGTESLLVLAYDDYNAALDERRRVKQALITSAQEALEQTSLAGPLVAREAAFKMAPVYTRRGATRRPASPCPRPCPRPRPCPCPRRSAECDRAVARRAPCRHGRDK